MDNVVLGVLGNGIDESEMNEYAESIGIDNERFKEFARTAYWKYFDKAAKDIENLFSNGDLDGYDVLKWAEHEYEAPALRKVDFMYFKNDLSGIKAMVRDYYRNRHTTTDKTRKN